MILSAKRLFALTALGLVISFASCGKEDKKAATVTEDKTPFNPITIKCSTDGSTACMK